MIQYKKIHDEWKNSTISEKLIYVLIVIGVIFWFQYRTTNKKLIELQTKIITNQRNEIVELRKENREITKYWNNKLEAERKENLKSLILDYEKYEKNIQPKTVSDNQPNKQ